jgi:hypothetical protein
MLCARKERRKRNRDTARAWQAYPLAGVCDRYLGFRCRFDRRASYVAAEIARVTVEGYGCRRDEVPRRFAPSSRVQRNLAWHFDQTKPAADWPPEISRRTKFDRVIVAGFTAITLPPPGEQTQQELSICSGNQPRQHKRQSLDGAVGLLVANPG